MKPKAYIRAALYTQWSAKWQAASPSQDQEFVRGVEAISQQSMVQQYKSEKTFDTTSLPREPTLFRLETFDAQKKTSYLYHTFYDFRMLRNTLMNNVKMQYFWDLARAWFKARVVAMSMLPLTLELRESSEALTEFSSVKAWMLSWLIPTWR